VRENPPSTLVQKTEQSSDSWSMKLPHKSLRNRLHVNRSCNADEAITVSSATFQQIFSRIKEQRDSQVGNSGREALKCQRRLLLTGNPFK